jgi:pimeloyl-ACP methyl ester carboxylesterase
MTRVFWKTIVTGLWGCLLLIPTAVSAASVVFEVEPTLNSTLSWGGNSGTVTEKVAQKYLAQQDQTICSVASRISKINTIAKTNAMLTVYQGGEIPEIGAQMVTVSVVGSTLSSHAAALTYAMFVLPDCLKLVQGQTYWFLFAASRPVPWLTTFSDYVSAYRNTDQFNNSSLWMKNCGACINPGVWKEFPDRELSLKLEGPEPLPPKEPVIIVPGILGTRLNRASDGEEVWSRTDKMFFSPADDYLDELMLDPVGHDIGSSTIIPTEIILDEAVAGLRKPVYKNLIDSFVDAGYASGSDLFTVPYDWRLDLSVSVNRLHEIFEKALAGSPTGKVNVIAHSMGGLLVKEYFRQTTSTASVGKLVLAGVPELGAPKAFKALQYGDDFGYRKLGLGANAAQMKKIAQNMPAVYQLLPSRAYVRTVGRYIVDSRITGGVQLDHAESIDFMIRDISDSRNRSLLDRADQFHNALDVPFNIPSASIYRLVGCQNSKTIGDIRFGENHKVYIDSIDGDGTVPLESALFSPAGTNYYALYGQTEIDHVGLVSDSRAVQLLRDIVVSTSTPVGSVGISVNKADCGTALPTTVSFSTHSPVTLHVYDAQGRHTGPEASGDIELGIPGSTYDRLGENSFVWLPASGVYKIVMQATDAGEFTLKLKQYSGATLTDQVSYIAVPLSGAQTLATASFTTISEPPKLQVDNNGDGQVDVQVAPTVSVSGSGVNDFEPPEIRIDFPSIEITDSGSGVASSTVTLDGTIINKESIAPLIHSGVHQLEVRAIDNAGNSAMQRRYCKKKI